MSRERVDTSSSSFLSRLWRGLWIGCSQGRRSDRSARVKVKGRPSHGRRQPLGVCKIVHPRGKSHSSGCIIEISPRDHAPAFRFSSDLPATPIFSLRFSLTLPRRDSFSEIFNFFGIMLQQFFFFVWSIHISRICFSLSIVVTIHQFQRPSYLFL